MSTEVYKKYLELSKATKAIGEEHTNDILFGAFEQVREVSKDVEFIVIQGYTPSFNDGDPCTFTYSVMVNDVTDYVELGQHTTKYRGKTKEEVEAEGEDWDEYVQNDVSERMENIDYRKMGKLVSDIFDPLHNLLLENFDSEFGFEIILIHNDGEFDIKVLSYDCGY